jgi:hypothetical protein
MPPDPILAASRRRPFLPFRLHLADGGVFDVRHPEMLMMAPAYLVVGVPAASGPPLTERVITLALGHVAQLEPLAGAPAPKDGQQGG